MEIERLTENDLPGLAGLYKQFWNEGASLEKMKSSLHKVGKNPNYIFLIANTFMTGYVIECDGGLRLAGQQL